MYRRSPYTWTGLGLLVAGGALLSSAFLIFHQVWLSALSISMLILSFILLALGKTIPDMSPEVCGLLLETGIALLTGARSLAFIHGREFVIPDDVKALLVPVLSHRLQMTAEAEMADISPEATIKEIATSVPVPKMKND